MNASRWSASLAAFREALRIATLRRVLGAWLAFNAAEWAIMVAILLYAYEATGPGSVGLVAVIQLVPAALLAARTGHIAERLAGRRALPAAYLVIGVGMLVTALAMAAAWPPLLVYALAASVVVAYTSVRPLQIAILPSLVGRAEQLTAANTLTTILEGAGVLIGPLACGVIVGVSSPAVVYLVGGLATLVGALLVRRQAVGGEAENPAPAPLHGSSDETTGIQGWRAVAAAPSRIAAIGLLATRFGVAAAMDVLVVFAAIELLDMGEAGAGYLSAAIGLGWVFGGGATIAVVGRPRLTPLTVLGAVIWAIPIVAVAIVAQAVPALVVLVIAGVGLAIVDVAVRVVLQRLVDIDQLASVFGVAEAASMGGAALGAFAAGVLVAVVGVEGAIMTMGIVLPVVALLAFAPLRAGEATVRIPFREIALLRGIPLFAPVPAPALEAAAAALEPTTMQAGDVVVREGDVGDRFYVIDAGAVRVDRGGAPVSTLGPGDSFGELALISDIPRTASVTATADGGLLTLDRDAFLVAITASPRATAEAKRVATSHLERDRAAAAGGTSGGAADPPALR